MSAATLLPVRSLPLRAGTFAATDSEPVPRGHPAARSDADAAQQVRACVVAVMVAGAVVTVPLMMLVVLVPALWTLPLLAALHTPVFAAMAGHRLTRRLASAQR